MTKIKEVYRCNICGNVVEVLNAGVGELVCCGEKMELLFGKSKDAGLEKHVPVIEKSENGYIVKVGSITHPMENAHYIQWIELIADGIILRKELKPTDEPKAEFCIPAKDVSARIYCNIHGLWLS
ncbi:MAG TPA: desulfoferrodoxin [Candidatus Woesearchaeota archaeon]|nr:desulfoferrodoxin [Candidatus Woesearchaeota archaeon]